VIHGTPEAVADQLLRLGEEMFLFYLLIAPLSEGTFRLFTERVLPSSKGDQRQSRAYTRWGPATPLNGRRRSAGRPLREQLLRERRGEDLSSSAAPSARDRYGPGNGSAAWPLLQAPPLVPSTSSALVSASRRQIESADSRSSGRRTFTLRIGAAGLGGRDRICHTRMRSSVLRNLFPLEPGMAASIFVESRYDPRYDLVEALDGRLFALAWSGSPLRRALARVAGERVRRRAWERLGVGGAGDYARERPGLSARELNELAHVDAALAKLPAISAALAEGRLGWSKARLLCRVATAEDEGRWLAAAGTVSAAELAQQVRAIDVGALEAGGAEPCDEEGEREVLRIRMPRRVKTKWGDVKRTVRRVAGEWLPNETCVELVAA